MGGISMGMIETPELPEPADTDAIKLGILNRFVNAVREHQTYFTESIGDGDIIVANLAHAMVDLYQLVFKRTLREEDGQAILAYPQYSDQEH